MRTATKILIADRNRHVRNLLSREFAAVGYQVQVAQNGQEVLNISNGEAPDLFILDSELPFLMELAVLKRLRERYPRLPVVIHSFTIPENSGPANEKSFVYVEKKGDTERLMAVVTQVIGDSRLGAPSEESQKGDWRNEIMDSFSSNIGFLEFMVPYMLFVAVAVLLGLRILKLRQW